MLESSALSESSVLSELFASYNLNSLVNILASPQGLSSALCMPVSGGYHNIGHAVAVAECAMQLAVEHHENLLPAPSPRVDVLSLSIAGLFHDAGHLRSATNPDHRNLSRAVITWLGFSRRNLKELESAGVTQEHVTNLILATNSGMSPSDSYSEEERIIFDADTFAGLREGDTPDKLVRYGNGLRAEGYGGAMSPMEFVKLRGVFSEAGERMLHNLEQ